MKKNSFYVSFALLITAISACGGARSPVHDNSQQRDISNAISVTASSYISWVSPSTYEDTTPLTQSEIGGYRIYVGTNRSTISFYQDLNSDEVTFSLSSLGTGIRYIAVSCFDTAGRESRQSIPIIVNITN